MDLRKERSLPKTEARAIKPTRQDKRIQRKDEGPAEMIPFPDMSASIHAPISNSYWIQSHPIGINGI